MFLKNGKKRQITEIYKLHFYIILFYISGTTAARIFIFLLIFLQSTFDVRTQLLLLLTQLLVFFLDVGLNDVYESMKKSLRQTSGWLAADEEAEHSKMQ